MATASTLHGTGAPPDRFSNEAASWDSNPFVHTATNAAYKCLSSTLPQFADTSATADHNLEILEIGCGTGLLSLQIASQPNVTRVTAIDAAPGMIKVLQDKVSVSRNDSPTKKVVPVCVLLEDPEDPSLPLPLPSSSSSSTNGGGDGVKEGGKRQKFDLITSHLVLHHIADVKSVLVTMFGCLKPGTGEVALTDFEDFGPEAKRFHPKSRLGSVEHHGIKKVWIEALLKEVGFVDVDVSVGFVLDKAVEKYEGEWGEEVKPKDGAMGEVMKFPFLLCRARRP